jgi:hypothetical protein
MSPYAPQAAFIASTYPGKLHLFIFYKYAIIELLIIFINMTGTIEMEVAAQTRYWINIYVHDFGLKIFKLPANEIPVISGRSFNVAQQLNQEERKISTVLSCNFACLFCCDNDNKFYTFLYVYEKRGREAASSSAVYCWPTK